MKKIEAYCKKTFLAFVILMPVSQASIAEPITVASVGPEDINLNSEGACRSKDGQSFDMRNLRHISNESIKMPVNDSEFILSINSDILIVVEVGLEDVRHIFNIKYSASEGEKLDVIVTFAELDHEDFVYWKESYVNRIYRHGLFKFDGDDLVPVCSGSGGIEVSH